MRQTVGFAKRDGVQVGAHPGLPDLQGFGRREMNLTVDEVYDIVVYQVGALKAFVEAAGLRLHHVKPHGSLYGMAHRREEIAQALCRAVRDIDPRLYLYIMKKGVIGGVAAEMGLRCVYELYADLGYDSQGNLVITRQHEAHTPEDVAARVVRMVREGRVNAVDGVLSISSPAGGPTTVLAEIPRHDTRRGPHTDTRSDLLDQPLQLVRAGGRHMAEHGRARATVHIHAVQEQQVEMHVQVQR